MVCIKEGDTVFFNVELTETKKHYPRYLKDGILNTNEDFDYGPFEELAKMIRQNITVHTFSYSFKQAGIY